MALSILLHPPTALWRREALAASRGTFWVRMDGASSLRIYTDGPHGRPLARRISRAPSATAAVGERARRRPRHPAHRAAAAHDRRRWLGRLDGAAGRVGAAWLQSAPAQGAELLPDHGVRGAERAGPAGPESAG